MRPRNKTRRVTTEGVRAERRPLLQRIPDWAIFLACSLLFLTLTILSLREKSSTFDEPLHLAAGYRHLRLNDFSFDADNPPLVKMLAGLPLLVTEVKWGPRTERERDLMYAHRFLYEENDADRLLFFGRMAVLPLGLLLAALVFLWTRQLFGRAAAIGALLAYTLEPNMLAHAPLVKNDLGAACFIFLAVFSFYRLMQRVSISHLVLAGLSLGLALITKFSTLALLPILFLLGISAVAARRPIELCLAGASHPLTTRLKKLLIVLSAMIGVGLVAYGIIWGGYQFRPGPYDGISFPERYSRDSWIGSVTTWVVDAKLLPADYLRGLGITMAKRKRFTYLMGEISTEGWWYYFIVTFLLKTPLPFLIILALTTLSLRRWAREHRVALLFLLLPVLIYFGIASASRFNIGHRHLLPIYPFLFVMAGSVVPWIGGQRLIVRSGVIALAVWYVFSSFSIFPHYLAYFNELAGGPDHGYKYLLDSNLDWGQDLKGLKRYMDAHGIERVWLSYFGTADPDYYKIAYNYLPSYHIFHPKMERRPTPYVAISASNLQGVRFPLLGLRPDYFEDFKRRQPIAKIGYSIFLYRVIQ